MTILSPAEQCSDETLAEALIHDEPALVSSLDFGPFVRQGVGAGPSLLIGDPSEITLLSSATASRLEYRMALLARPGDHVMVRHRDPDFEAYLGAYLGLADVTFHKVNPKSLVPVTQQAWTSANWIDTFAAIAERRGSLTIQSYLTTGHTWRLAQAIGEQTRRVIYVSGPSPRISQRANDKLWFAGLARRILGKDATPPTLSAYGPAATAGLVRRISKGVDQVIVKIPDSAGSAGNLRLDSSLVRHTPLADLRRFLLSRLHAMGWQDNYPVLVGVWDKDVICSPSAQLWLPHISEGKPRVEGIFEQRVQTSAAAFVGAARSTLPGEVQDQLRAQATRIASVLQRLGYYGRCSLDAVLCRTKNATPMIHWIECNGRWGGVSIPMTAASHLTGQSPAIAISIVQENLPGQYLGMNELLHRLQGLLLRTDGRTTGLVVLSPPANPNGTLVNLLAVAETQPAADDMLRTAISRLARSGQL